MNSGYVSDVNNR